MSENRFGTPNLGETKGVFIMFDTVARLNQIVEARGMTLTEVSRKCGLNHSTICMTVRRGGQLKIDTIEKVCIGLNMTLGEFFTPPNCPEKRP